MKKTIIILVFMAMMIVAFGASTAQAERRVGTAGQAISAQAPAYTPVTIQYDDTAEKINALQKQIDALKKNQVASDGKVQNLAEQISGKDGKSGIEGRLDKVEKDQKQLSKDHYSLAKDHNQFMKFVAYYGNSLFKGNERTNERVDSMVSSMIIGLSSAFLSMIILFGIGAWICCRKQGDAKQSP